MQLRDDFIETPPLPPDAIAWVVSDFQRESLEPSSTYQVVSTAAPILSTQKTKAPSTDNFTFRTDKRPIKNILTNALTKPFKSTTTNNNSAQQLANATLAKTTITNQNNTNSSDVNKNNENDIKTAPSYTFYASRKILERSGFVLHTSRDVLEHLQEWFGVAYPLAKLGNPHIYLKCFC